MNCPPECHRARETAYKLARCSYADRNSHLQVEGTRTTVTIFNYAQYPDDCFNMYQRCVDDEFC